jgi:hypothetical protein
MMTGNLLFLIKSWTLSLVTVMGLAAAALNGCLLTAALRVACPVAWRARQVSTRVSIGKCHGVRRYTSVYVPAVVGACARS